VILIVTFEERLLASFFIRFGSKRNYDLRNPGFYEQNGCKFSLGKRSFFETYEQGPAKPLFLAENCLIKALQESIFQISVKSEVFDND